MLWPVALGCVQRGCGVVEGPPVQERSVVDGILFAAARFQTPVRLTLQIRDLDGAHLRCRSPRKLKVFKHQCEENCILRCIEMDKAIPQVFSMLVTRKIHKAELVAEANGVDGFGEEVFIQFTRNI